MHTCIQGFTPYKSAPHTVIAKDKCGTQETAKSKRQSNKEQREGKFSNLGRHIR